MSALHTLREHAEELSAATRLSVQVEEEAGAIFVVVASVPLPSGVFRIDTTDILFIADQQYPLSALDMFWASVEAVRVDGSVPQAADQIETHLRRQWRRFSWHRNGIWNPASNGLLDHFAFTEARLAQEAQP